MSARQPLSLLSSHVARSVLFSDTGSDGVVEEERTAYSSPMRSARLVTLGLLLAMSAIAIVVLAVRSTVKVLAPSSLQQDVTNLWVCGTRRDVNDFTSVASMEKAGWAFNWHDEHFQFKPPLDDYGGSLVNLNSYWGWKYPGDGEISLQLEGQGVARLSFGNAYHDGIVTVSLDGTAKFYAKALTPDMNVTFLFENKQILAISEGKPRAIIVVNRLDFSCVPPTPMPTHSPTPLPTTPTPVPTMPPPPTSQPTPEPIAPLYATELKDFPRKSYVISDAKWQHVSPDAWLCGESYQDKYIEEAPAFGTPESQGAREWCATRCLQDASCAGFAYPYWGNDGRDCHIYVRRSTAAAGWSHFRPRGEPTSGKNSWSVINETAACEGTAGLKRLYGAAGYTLSSCKAKCEATLTCRAIDFYREGGWCNLYGEACSNPQRTMEGASAYKLDVTKTKEFASKEIAAAVEEEESSAKSCGYDPDSWDYYVLWNRLELESMPVK